MTGVPDIAWSPRIDSFQDIAALVLRFCMHEIRMGARIVSMSRAWSAWDSLEHKASVLVLHVDYWLHGCHCGSWPNKYLKTISLNVLVWPGIIKIVRCTTDWEVKCSGCAYNNESEGGIVHEYLQACFLQTRLAKGKTCIVDKNFYLQTGSNLKRLGSEPQLLTST